MFPLAYFITVHTYGTWLHGTEKGSVDKAHNNVNTPRLPPDVLRKSLASEAMTQPAIYLDTRRRCAVDAAIRGVCVHRSWILHALHVRVTHWHAVVTAHGQTPERVMNDFKSYATRALRERELLSSETSPWIYHGSTRYLNTANGLAGAIRCVVEDQGSELPMPPSANFG